MRFETPLAQTDFQSEYDISSSEIDDLQRRNPMPVKVLSFQIDSAGTLNIPEPGYGFSIRGFVRSNNAKSPTAFVNVGVNMDDTISDPSKVFPGKSGRGFFGFFTKLALSWPTDPNGPGNSIEIVIYKSKNFPHMGGREAT